MDKDRIKRILAAQAKRQQIDDDGLIDEAIELAGPYFWNCYKWRFRRREDTITLTASQEYVNLPDDFARFKSLRYRDGTAEGWQLTYEDEDTYEYQNPNPSIHTENEPQQVKIVYDSEQDIWRAYFTPIPDSAYAPSLIYFVKWGSLGSIPDGFEKVFLASCWLFIHANGTTAYQAADIGFNMAKAEAIKDIDPVYQGEPSIVKRSKRFDPEGSSNVPADWYKVSDGSDY
jgi:hypothetical protein